MRSILYITYDGLTDALGQSQILAYLKRLNSFDNRIIILSYEKTAKYKREKKKIFETVAPNKLTWVPLKYTKYPPVISTIFDIIRGYRMCRKLHNQYNFDIVHCRGYLPAIIGRKLKKRIGLKFIFDMRGWWADEKKESGNWNFFLFRGVYKYFKKAEGSFFKESDFVVSLTEKGKQEIARKNLIDENKIGVIPTCVDFEIFKARDISLREKIRKELGFDNSKKIFVYSGSLGGNYRPDILMKVFNEFIKIYPDSLLLILSKDNYNKNLIEQLAENNIIRFSIKSVPFSEVTKYLTAADVGFIYYKMAFSTIGRSPTKLGEYWASGIPVISFNGIGDMEDIFQKYPDGGVLLNRNEWRNQLQCLKFPDPEQLRGYANDYFHIDKGVKFYQRIYEHLAPFHITEC